MPWYESFDREIAQRMPALQVLREESMAGHTTFRVGGPARRMARPKSPEEMAALLTLAEELDCEYLNVAEAVTGEDGCLKTDLTWDGVHLNIKGCKIWLEHLKTHSV